MASRAMRMRDASQRFDTGVATHVGRVRERNEDSYLARPDTGIWAVADGMGGLDAGDFASATVIEALGSIATPRSAAELLAWCEERVVAANTTLHEL
jgi:protein phosphatase